MNVIILCAGLGTRLRPYTDAYPKPSIPFLRVPLFHYVWRLIEPIGIENLVVNLHHLPEKMKYTVKDLKPSCKNLYFTDETKEILDSGGALGPAKKYLSTRENFILANGDELLIPENSLVLKDLLNLHISRNALATLLVTENDEVGKKFGGAWCDNENRVNCFSKKPVEGFKGWHYTGFMALNKRIFDYLSSSFIPENLLYDVVARGMKNNESVFVHPNSARWFEVGNEQDFLSSTKEVCNLLNETALDKFSRMGSHKNAKSIDELRQFIRYSFLEDSVIETSQKDVFEMVESTITKIKES